MWMLSPKAEQIRKREQESVNAWLKAQKRDPIGEYELDLRLFGRIPFGHSLKHEFLIRCWNHESGAADVLEADGHQNYWHIRMAQALCRWKRLILLGCASSGKTHRSAAYGKTLWKSKPFGTSVYLSTTSAEAGEARTWGTVKDLFNIDKYRIGKIINSLRVITLDEETRGEDGEKERDYRNGIRAVLIKAGAEGKNVVGSICGRKNDQVIWIAQPLTSKVLTPDGWTTIGRLSEGDQVMGRNGKPQSITKLHPIGEQPVFEVKFCDGSVAHSTGDHLWTFQDYNNGKPLLTKPLSYFTPKRLTIKNEWGTPRWSLPRSEYQEFSTVPEPKVSPYVIGVLIGDGCITQHPSFWNFDNQDTIEKIKKELPIGHSISSPREGQFYIKRDGGKNFKNQNLVTSELRRMGLLGTKSHNKFVPKEILFGSRETRIKALQGLLDTDGTVLHSTIRFTSVSEQLRKDVIHLVRSLGEYARECSPYTVVINIEGFVPFRAERKIARMRPSKFKQRRRSVVSITEIGTFPVRCISVSNADGLYVTDDFVLTHNCDELNFLDPGVLDARVNLFSNDFAQFVGIGNAPSEGSPLYTDAEPFGPKFPDGWRSVDKDIHEEWPTRTGYCLYFNGEKSPNMRVPRGQPPRFKKLMDWAKRDEILATAGGEDTPVFYTQFYGFPPTVDIPDKILTWKLLQSNGAFDQPLWAGSPIKTIAGLDLGFREGGDPCVISFSQIGKDTRGKTIACFEKDGIPLLPSQKSKDPFESQIAGLVIKHCRERECHHIALDVSGDGGVLLQAIEKRARDEKFKLEVIPVSFSGVADDSVVIPGEKRTAREMYDRKVTQLWAGFRVCVQNGVIRGLNEQSKTVTELCGRKFSTDERKRWSIEKKSDFKKRLRRSPDFGDAACLNAFLALKHGLSGGDVSPQAKETIRKEERAAAVPRYSAGHTQKPLYSGR